MEILKKIVLIFEDFETMGLGQAIWKSSREDKKYAHYFFQASLERGYTPPKKIVTKTPKKHHTYDPCPRPTER